MQIIQKIEDFLFDLFPDAKADKELLKEELTKYYKETNMNGESLYKENILEIFFQWQNNAPS